MKYAVIYETSPGSCSAYVPDLPGCVVAASTLEETRELMEEAIEFHIEGMRLHCESVPFSYEDTVSAKEPNGDPISTTRSGSN